MKSQIEIYKEICKELNFKSLESWTRFLVIKTFWNSERVRIIISWWPHSTTTYTTGRKLHEGTLILYSLLTLIPIVVVMVKRWGEWLGIIDLVILTKILSIVLDFVTFICSKYPISCENSSYLLVPVNIFSSKFSSRQYLPGDFRSIPLNKTFNT